MGAQVLVPGVPYSTLPSEAVGKRVRSWVDYLSLTKPTITLLIVLVAVGGYFVAGPPSVSVSHLLVLVAAGGAASAGAAVLNHYFDRDIDRVMRRTRSRPLASARITPPSVALVAGAGMTAVGWIAAWLFLNPLVAVSVALGTVTYVVVYTLWLKRRSSWNIVVGGFAGSAPALAGSAAAVGHWTWGAVALALLLFLWTPPHFWSLALVLREDYLRAGLPMLPRMTDPRYSGRMVVFSAGLLFPATALLAVWGNVTVPVAVGLFVAAALFLVSTLPLVWRVDRTSALRGFIVSGPYLIAVLVTLCAGWVALHPALPWHA